MSEIPKSPAPTSSASILLDFEPVVRRVKRPDGWTPDLQRQFIALLAELGSPQAACTAMQKHVTGIEALYKVPAADSFRAAWDQALAIGRRRQGLDAGPPHPGPVPGIKRRVPRAQPAPIDAEDGFPDPVDPEEDGMDEDGKLEIFDRLIRKFMGKVAQERAARIGGRVVEADFYLRQITCLEISFDLLAERAGKDAWQAIAQCRRGGHGILEIGDTPMSRLLDNARREQWEKMGEPARPEHPPERFLTDHGTHRTEAAQCLGKASPPLPGYDPDEWAEMSMDEQKQALQEQHKRDAEEQIEFEARCAAEAAEWRARSTADKSNDGD